MKAKVKDLLTEYKVLTRSIPSISMTFFIISVIVMNLFASKEIVFPFSNIGGDCGFTISWLSFLSMDIIVKRFGPKASIMLTVLAEAINLLFCGFFWILAQVHGNWSMYYELGDVANTAINSTFANSWYVVLGSATAFIISGCVNAFMNWWVGKMFKKTSFVEYCIRSYVSTFIGQFVDNMVFALLVAYNFFGWNIWQCLTCSFLGCIVELLAEVIFGPIGYRIVRGWERDGVGNKYILTYCKDPQTDI